jgi:hypothetical protein
MLNDFTRRDLFGGLLGWLFGSLAARVVPPGAAPAAGPPPAAVSLGPSVVTYTYHAHGGMYVCRDGQESFFTYLGGQLTSVTYPNNPIRYDARRPPPPAGPPEGGAPPAAPETEGPA